MNTHEQAFWNGFVKRAADYGLSAEQAMKLAAEPAAPATPTFKEQLGNVVNFFRGTGAKPALSNIGSVNKLMNERGHQNLVGAGTAATAPVR